MVSVYSIKRKEPRVKIRAAVTLVHESGGRTTTFETTTIDVSPRGASVALNAPLAIGAIVRFTAKTYAFSTRAVVRSVGHDRVDGEYSVGLEYLDHANPLVVWERCARDQPVGDPSDRD